MTVDQITEEMEAGSFSLTELNRIDRVCTQARISLRSELDVETAQAPPSKLIPDWSLYTPEDGKSQRDYDNATMQLNTAGRALVVAIRDGKYIRAAFEKIAKLQNKYVSLGAADTEGREALWELVQKSCKGTHLEPQEVWDAYYRA